MTGQGTCTVGVTWHDRISIDQAVLVGKPVVKGTRLAVEFIVDLKAQGWSDADILNNYPGLTGEDIIAVARPHLRNSTEMLPQQRQALDHPRPRVFLPLKLQ
jgi:uncharacterized protein (DUF433 family)